MSVEDRAVVITGGTGHLGRAVTRRFVGEGARVAVTYRETVELERLGEERGQVLLLECDLTEERQVEAALRQAREELGGVEVLLNLAGGYAGGQPVAELEESVWDRMMDINLKTAFLCCKHTLPYMLEGGWGRIVNVSSKLARDLPAKSAAAAVAKAGVLALTSCLAQEVKGKGVSVMAILPSVIDTPPNREAMPKADPGRWVSPEAIAEVLALLAGEGGGHLNGALLPLYGAL